MSSVGAMLTGEPERSWYYLTDDGQNHGPFGMEAMKVLFKDKYVTEDALVWADGEPDWMPLKMAHALYAAVVFQDEDAKQKGSAPKDAAMATFEAEIAAIEGDAAEVESPSEDEREFEDDDGTAFIWDSTLRKFRPKDIDLPGAGSTDADANASGAPGGTDGAQNTKASQVQPDPLQMGYTAEMMMFEQEEEVVPTIQQAIEQEQAEIAKELQEEAAKALSDNTQRARQSEQASTTAKQDAVSTAAAPSSQESPGKRKAETAVDENGEVKKSKKQEAAWFELKHNTSVYVTGIPDDATIKEIAEEFQRCGIIKLDEDKQPRIKIYRDKTGAVKGDCLVTFLQQPSVKLAVTVMDGRQLRPGRGANMTVQEAKFQQKGDFVAKKKGNKKASRKKLIEQQERLLGWQGYDDAAKASEVTVILKHMFTVEEMRAQPQLESELQADVMSECKQFGAIDKLKVYGGSPDGVVWIKFRTPESAQSCISLMNGRYFAGRQVLASLWDGKTSYAASSKAQETEEEQAARLEAFARELETS